MVQLAWLCRCIPFSTAFTASLTALTPSSIDRMLSLMELISCPACSCKPNWMATSRNRGTTSHVGRCGLFQKGHSEICPPMPLFRTPRDLRCLHGKQRPPGFIYIAQSLLQPLTLSEHRLVDSCVGRTGLHCGHPYLETTTTASICFQRKGLGRLQACQLEAVHANDNTTILLDNSYVAAPWKGFQCSKNPT